MFEVWVNGGRRVRLTGRNTEGTDRIYFKYGIYRSSLERYRTAMKVAEVPGQVVYFDEVRKARTREGVDQQKRRQLAPGHHKVANAHLALDEALAYPLVDALVAPADQQQARP